MKTGIRKVKSTGSAHGETLRYAGGSAHGETLRYAGAPASGSRKTRQRIEKMADDNARRWAKRAGFIARKTRGGFGDWRLSCAATGRVVFSGGDRGDVLDVARTELRQ